MPDAFEESLDQYMNPDKYINRKDYLKLSKKEMLQLDYDGKVKLLEAVAYELMDMRLEYAKAKAKAAEMQANIQVMNSVRTALQSAIKAEYG